MAAGGETVGRPALVIETPGVRAEFPSNSELILGQAVFSVAGEAATVELMGLRVNHPPVSSTKSEAAPGGQPPAVTTYLNLGSKRTIKVITRAAADPALGFVLVGDSPMEICLELVIKGAERLIYPEGDRFTVLPVQKAMKRKLTGRGIIFQNSSTQDGLTVSCEASETGFEVMEVGSNLILRLTLPVRTAKGLEPSLKIAAFRGDALLAWEDLSLVQRSAANRPAAQPPLAAATPQPADPGDPKKSGEEPVPDKRWVFFPDEGRAFKPLQADPREAVFHLGFMVNDRGKTYEDIGFGGDLGLLSHRFAEDERLSLTVRGLFTARFDVVSKSFDLLNTDFIGGLALGYQRGPEAFELLVYHQSSHLGDEILDRRERTRIDYAREAVRLLWSHEWGGLRIYAGPSYNFHALPNQLQNRLTLQTGAEYQFNLWNTNLFAAADIQARQEYDWTPNTTFQLGVELGDPARTKNRQYIFGEVYAGYSNMGQFWRQWENYELIGVGYRFR